MKDVVKDKKNVNKFLATINKDKYSDENLKYLVEDMLPKQIIIETIRGCNLKCPICPLQWITTITKEA
ncbi:hypothetical protein [Clostridium homopropionicum]|uniref:hypothetical protein n=1 Tax=Clostridium homopropionicum TaxID=36844 RepID=UPI0013791AC2|nr:hypothetical protein [Clostridium homopropionicum]